MEWLHPKQRIRPLICKECHLRYRFRPCVSILRVTLMKGPPGNGPKIQNENKSSGQGGSRRSLSINTGLVKYFVKKTAQAMLTTKQRLSKQNGQRRLQYLETIKQNGQRRLQYKKQPGGAYVSRGTMPASSNQYEAQHLSYQPGHIPKGKPEQILSTRGCEKRSTQISPNDEAIKKTRNHRFYLNQFFSRRHKHQRGKKRFFFGTQILVLEEKTFFSGQN